MLELKSKTIAVICNYQLRPDRIGGMDRFFVAYDTKAKLLGCDVKWFFKGQAVFDFYKDLDIVLVQDTSVEATFLNHLKQNTTVYNCVVTHFTELCTSFYKKVKQYTKAYCIAVDHNPRPLDGFPLKKRIKLKVKGVLYSKFTDQFIAVSKYTKHHILNDYGYFLRKKVKVIYNGIDVSIYKQQELRQAKQFIVASHLRQSKGIQDLLAALDQINSADLEGVSIDIYGEGPMENELKALSQQYKLQNIVSFKGSSANLPKLFRNYDYMIQPTYMECFSLSLLESLSANVPVITTQVGGNLELITDGDNGFVFQAGDVSALKQVLESILKKEQKIAKDVFLLVHDQFSLDKMVDEHFNLVECI
ncbi:glycosyltransferase family 4 protein [Meridianimaribacter flavus]|uniref:Glycosyl transferase family 4 n=1 Tax=Meridianimaribacter flavus TaxID=571115 RepID=A0ABY2G4Q5_9FLAO|nr:glycosyltransferase family 4 protein [Meridianimaribacter flavus]TDY11786.1 glycosyl transferase family 4 [Meridianimaribacter flavus]